jgi:hypothetical protein
MDKFLLSLGSAFKVLQTADHMIYITFPLIKENRLLIKILNEIYTAVLTTINVVLQYDYSYKKIVLHKDAGLNFNTFKEKCAPRFGISQDEIAKIVEIFKLIEEHRQSPMEFVRQDKFVILSDNLSTDVVTVEKLKDYLLTAKNILQKVRNKVTMGG